MENLIKMDDLGVPLFFGNTHLLFREVYGFFSASASMIAFLEV